MPSRIGRARHVLFTVAAFLPLFGCQGGGGGDAVAGVSVARVDSAGLEVVTVTVDRAAAPTYGVLATPAERRIGSLDGASGDAFGRVEDVVQLSDGGFAVLDGQAAEVKLFDPAGRLTAVVGTKGDGPGEFQGPVTLAELPGDTIAVFDPTPRRITHLARSGAVGRVVTLDDPGAFTPKRAFSTMEGSSHSPIS